MNKIFNFLIKAIFASAIIILTSLTAYSEEGENNESVSQKLESLQNDI